MKKILIVEDDVFLANAYRVKLVKAGFEIQMATDGVEALNILKTFIPDLILLDLIMPVKDGFSTLHDIKANPTLKAIPVLVASNLGQEEDIERAKKLGAIDFIVKSNVTLAQLVEKINNIVS